MRKFALCLFLVACTGEVDPTDPTVSSDDEKDDTLHPTGSENLGYLDLEPPASSRGFYAQTVDFRGTPIDIGKKVRLKKGTGCLGVNPIAQAVDCTVTVEAKKTTTYKLASLHPHFQPTIFDVDAGPQVALQLTARGVLYNYRAFDPDVVEGLPSKDILALPGDYVFDYGLPIFNKVSFTLTAGKAKDLDLGVDKRATLHIVMPSREYPTFYCNRPQLLQPVDGRGVPVIGTRTNSTETDATYRVFPFAPGGGHYLYTVQGLSATLDPKPGDKLTLKVKRIDVDDVNVTREDGSSYTVAGTWTVLHEDANGQFAPFAACGNIPTKRGIDVVPGVYKIVTSYNTQEGPATEEDVLDLR